MLAAIFLAVMTSSHPVEAANGYYNGLKLPYPAGQARLVVRSTGHGPGRHAVDFGMTYEDVLAMYGGRVVAVGVDRPTGGKLIIIDHGDNYCALYLHLDRFYVKYGQVVQQGEKIALSGNTGQSTGPHLHAAVYRKSGGACGAAGTTNEVVMLFDEHPRGELRGGDWIISMNGKPATPYYPSLDKVAGNSILVKWNDYSNNEKGFKIERKDGVGAWLEITSVAANTIQLLSNGLAPNTQYCYRVRSFNDMGASAYSSPVCATTGPPEPPQPEAASIAAAPDLLEQLTPDESLAAVVGSADTSFAPPDGSSPADDALLDLRYFLGRILADASPSDSSR